MYYRLKYDESNVRYVISDSDDVVMDKNAPKNLVVLKDLNLNDVVIKVRGEKKTDGAPLYLVKSSDGNIKKVDNIDSISPNDIKTMMVENRIKRFKEARNKIIQNAHLLPYPIRMEKNVTWLHIDTLPQHSITENIHLF